MSLEQNKAIICQFYKAYNQGNLAQAREMMSPNIVIHTMMGTVIRGSDDSLEQMQERRSIFPDICFTFEEVIAEGDKVVSRGTFTATHCGEFLGIPPTGKQVTSSVVHVDRLEDGKIVEHWSLGDLLSVLQQLCGEDIASLTRTCS